MQEYTDHVSWLGVDRCLSLDKVQTEIKVKFIPFSSLSNVRHPVTIKQFKCSPGIWTARGLVAGFGDRNSCHDWLKQRRFPLALCPLNWLADRRKPETDSSLFVWTVAKRQLQVAGAPLTASYPVGEVTSTSHI
ncbi:hypothetical protein J6590_002800 [Homalodisca vitripennis]|nr:hypothetical protein J6590_002800 [Homalodisca vitripennis]